MPEYERFPHAPISEALLELLVDVPREVSLAQLETFQKDLTGRYPVKKIRASGTVSLRVKEGELFPTINQASGPNGYFFQSQDGKQVVQARQDGFAFTRLRPYDCWATFRDEAKELWSRYRQIAGPVAVTRLALRYINRIEIPYPFNDFKEYILTVPEVAPELPQGLGGFVMRLIIPDPAGKGTAILIQTIEQIDKEKGVLPFIFDIDVFKEARIEVDSENISNILEDLHILKNEMFFKSVTPKAKELFR